MNQKKASLYKLIDTGDGEKLEQFGQVTLARPCSQAVWKKSIKQSEWKKADASFSREEEFRWKSNKRLPDSWIIEHEGIKFKLKGTDFGHVGIFPEHASMWNWMTEIIQSQPKPINVLNLFAYSGGATLAAAKAGANVCHLDASKGMVSWARENAEQNNLESAPIRWIVDDVMKFLEREIRRGRTYEGIILDPPTYGRGAKGEQFKIEELINPLLDLCCKLLSDNAQFLLLTCHTPGFTPIVLHNLLSQRLEGFIEQGELTIPTASLPLPSGSYARWRRG